MEAQSHVTLGPVVGKTTGIVRPGWADKIPTILAQAVVVPGDKVYEGTIIKAVAPGWFEIIRLLSEDPDLAFRIDPREWEELIAGAYERRGFKVTLTPKSADFGRDVIAEKAGWGSVRFLDQVKAYKPGHLVTANDVRSLIGVVAGDLRASKGIVTTTSGFAPRITDDPSIAPFLPTRIELIDGPELMRRLGELVEEHS